MMDAESLRTREVKDGRGRARSHGPVRRLPDQRAASSLVWGSSPSSRFAYFSV